MSPAVLSIFYDFYIEIVAFKHIETSVSFTILIEI